VIDNAAQQPTDDGVSAVLNALGPAGTATLLAVGALLLLKLIGPRGRGALSRWAGRQIRRALRAAWAFLRVALWAARMRMPIRLALRLQPERWREMCHDRGMIGLKRGKVRRTATGISIAVTLNGKMDLAALAAKLEQLETGLGVRRQSLRIEPGEFANKVRIGVILRNPLRKPIPWVAPTGPVSIRDLVPLSMQPTGEWVEIDPLQRILFVGASGAGKSSVQRVAAAPIVLASDAELEIWDLKGGTESQHFEGLADRRITTAAQCADRINELMDVELPRRAAIMTGLKTSTWPITPQHPARIVMVDEGASLIRELDKDDLNRCFTLMEQARAFGIYIWWATQFPLAANLPTQLRSQFSCIVALKMRRKSESKVVFEDLVSEGWTPHRLPGTGWVMVRDDDHDEPTETRAAWLPEGGFRKLRAARPAPSPTVPPRPAYAPTAGVVTLVKDVEPASVYVDQAGDLTPEEQVLAALRRAGTEGLSAAEVQLATGLAKTPAYQVLGKLTKAGTVVKPRHGLYALASTAMAGEVSA
jgi:hypothetical protein